MCTKSLFLLIFALLAESWARRSGVLYVDNENNQTVIDHFLTAQEKKEVQHEILNLLGLPERPRVLPQPSTLKSSAPQFLLDVYQSLLEEEPSQRIPRSEFNISGSDLHAIDESDVIMSFTSHSHHSGGVRHEHGKRLWFDVSEVPVGEMVVGAELRIYQEAYSDEPVKSVSVTVYQLVSADYGRDMELEYVADFNTSSDHEGWFSLNVTGPFTSWVAFPDSNLGLYLSVHYTGKPGHEIRPEDVGIVSSKREKRRQPFMVAFLKSSYHEETVRSRSRRELTRRRKKSENNPGEISYARNPLYESSSSHWSSRSCQIHTLYVSFRDLEWQDWIIAPEGYNAFYCSGECNFPLNAHMNATNHAIVQTLVHLLNPQSVPKPCCAPTKLTPISVLYFLDDTNVILQKYKNMVVKSCGCH